MFNPPPPELQERLERVFPGIVLGPCIDFVTAVKLDGSYYHIDLANAMTYPDETLRKAFTPGLNFKIVRR